MDDQEKAGIFGRLRLLYHSEKIRPPRPKPIPEKAMFPELLQQLRVMQRDDRALRESTAELFYRQGKLAESYTDDTVYTLPVLHYYPTYKVLSDNELRGYFGWRTRWRSGQKERTSLSFAFIYIYELLNGIGTTSVADGYAKLTAFAKDYGALDERVVSYLDLWIRDYVLYHQMDPSLLPKDLGMVWDSALLVLLQYEKSKDDEIFAALDVFSTYHLSKSKLYKSQSALVERLVGQLYRKLQAYYQKKHRKKTFVEEYIGEAGYTWLNLFDNAVFLKQPDDREFTVTLSPVYSVTNRHGNWSERCYDYSGKRLRKLGKLMKTWDSLLREKLDLPPIMAPFGYKWLRQLVEDTWAEEVQRQKLEEKRKVVFHFDQLDTIRQEAAVTRERLMTEEERQEELSAVETIVPQKEEGPIAAPHEETATASEIAGKRPWGLTEDEEAFLRCLLYGKDTSWLSTKGLMRSVLVDAINEKCYEAFGDTVLGAGEPPCVLEDYAEELKETIKETVCQDKEKN